MRNSILASMAVVLAFLFTLGFGAGVFAQDSVQVSPATILLGAGEQPEDVTVHVAIPYNKEFVVVLAVGEQQVEAVRIFADDCGDLVAKFVSTDVKSALEEEVDKEKLPSVVELTLSVKIGDDVTFSGSDMVRVVEFAAPVDPPGKS